MHNGYHMTVYASRRHHHWVATRMSGWSDDDGMMNW